MTDYWKSNPKKWCDLCKCWIADNKISVNNHESASRHQGNVKKKLDDLRKNARHNNEGKMREKISLINDKAFVGMMKDIESNPSLAKRYGVSLTDKKYSEMQEKLKEIEKKKSKNKDGKGKSGNKNQPSVSALQHTVNKPVTYEWKEVKMADGQSYYWNKKSGITQWERPQGSIQPICDSQHVQKEKERLDTFVFNRLIELSESGSAEASEAVCQAFDASTHPEEKPKTAIELLEEVGISVETESGSSKTEVKKQSEPKQPLFNINLLGEWQPVIPEIQKVLEDSDKEDNKEVKSMSALIQTKAHRPSARQYVKQDNRIKMRIASLAKTRSVDDNSEQLVEKAELISRLSETSENNIFAAQYPDFVEKSAAVSLAAQKAVQRLLDSSNSSSPSVCQANPTGAPAIAFKRKKGGTSNRNIRSRRDDD